MTDELERIRVRKMEELRRQAAQRQKLEEDKKKGEDAKKKILAVVFEPDATQYLIELKKRDATTATEIENTILKLVLSRQLKYKVDAVDIETLERRIKGIEPKITIKRRGKEEVDLTDKLKEDEDR
ncbi:MAG: DNA-binding protein [Candidatus Atabeyarchaeum deiterrae]